MSNRTFPEERIEVEGRQHKAMKVTCAHCDAVGYHCFQTNVRMPPIASQQHFQHQGWAIGSNPRKDFCPLHAHPRQRKGNKKMADISGRSAPAGERKTVAEPPREMGRDERRIINDKLDEVYGKSCYKTPWTDVMVANDLGVPRDWVAQVRDQFFGPEGSNPQLDEFLAARDKLADQITALSSRYETMVKASDDYRQMHIEVRDQMTAVQQLGKRIEREIGR